MVKKKICANCGREFVLSHCYNSDCVFWREQNTKEEVNRLFAKLKQITTEFNEKTIDNYLSVVDIKEFIKLKNKIDSVIKWKGRNEQWDNYWSADADFQLLKTHLNNLEKVVQENASPQLQDKASPNKERKRKGNKKCYHENVEKYEDKSCYYCTYCWDDNSPEFLKVLERKGLKQDESSSPPNKDQEQRERERERRK